MVCSACGFENGSAMRFCGMCGTPLPHAPLTTPGAQSTLNLTRVPVEAGTASQDTSSTPTRSHESTPGNGRVLAIAGSSTASSATPVAEAPAKELVPDVPLDEYLQNFHYEPPSDPDEVTMRGDAAPSPEVEAPAPPPSAQRVNVSTVRTPQVAASTGPVVMARSDVVKAPAEAVAERPAVPEDTVRRLGIEPEEPEEERIQRPRFLDINEPAKETAVPTGAGTSTIVGPSFLGLSDAPLIEAESLPAEIDETEHKSHWRGWVAFAILLIFAVLGVVQWRAQTGNSPLQVVKDKWYSLRHAKTQQATNQTAPADPLAADTIQKPATQTESPTPQATTPANPAAETATTSNTSSATPPATNPATPQQSVPVTATPSSTTQVAPPPAAPPAKQSASAKQQSPPTIGNSQAAPPLEKAPAKTVTQASAAPPDTTTETPKPKRPTDDGANQPRSKATPGADEMAKAKDASDAAASAAWLWKATAKGNPEAPVQLADMYIKGTGVPRSCEQAVVLLKTAAEKENALARNRLASMYATGNCVQRNRVEAYRWLSAALSANPQSQWAQQNRDILWNQMTPDEQAAAQRYR